MMSPDTTPPDFSASLSHRLADLDYSDLMLWPDGRGFLRHVVGYEGPVVPVPAEYLPDVERLQVFIKSQTREREFFLTYDQVPYRVARIDTVNGAGYFLRRPKFPVPALDTLGLAPAMVEALRALGRHSGMVLMAGATGSGKTTTIYSLLTELVTQRGDIAVAVEDPPEIPAQGQYGEHSKGLWYQIDAASVGGFEVAMIAAMRYNPRFILLGEIRSPKVANEAIRAAVNGHLVLATIHGSSLPGAIMALQQIAAAATGSIDLARSILADGLTAVIHQSLEKDPDHPGKRVLKADMLCLGNEHGLRTKIRSGKLEQLSTDIEAQRMRIARGLLPTEL
jgi:twitching motility protein PilT